MTSFEDAERQASGKHEQTNGNRNTAPAIAMRPSRLSALFARAIMLGVYSSAIIFFGTRRQLEFPGNEILVHDKLLHAVAFGGVGVLSYRLIRFAFPTMSGRLAALFSIGAAFSLGAGLELIQARLPYRSMEFADLVADTLGAMISVPVAQWRRLERPLLDTWWA